MFIKITIIRELEGKDIIQSSLLNLDTVNRFYIEDGKAFVEYKDKEPDEDGVLYNLRDEVRENVQDLVESLVIANQYIKVVKV